MLTLTRAAKWLGVGLAVVVLVSVVSLLLAGLSVTLPGEEKTPSGLTRYTSQYLTMRDGVDIAVDVWLPPDYDESQKLPVLMRATRYGRAYRVGFAARVLMALGKVSGDPNFRPDIRVLNEEGYTIVKVDARGSGASFGERLMEWSDDEVADYGEVAQWITEQPWSNGSIGAYGVSYDGNAAEMIAAAGHPAVLAVAPLYAYFDPFQNLIRPGGVYDEYFMNGWSNATEAMDKNIRCRGGGFKCWWRDRLSDGPQPVQGRDGLKKRNAALAARNNPTVLEQLAQVEFRDDIYGSAGKPLDASSPYKRARLIEQSGAAMYVVSGWYDSLTADGAIARYKTLSNPQILILSPQTHGGKHDADPYNDADTPVSPPFDEQYRQLARFFDPILKGDMAPSEVSSEIRYYTMGKNTWQKTKTWPPAHMSMQRWWLGANAELSPTAPLSYVGDDTCTVDMTASSGRQTRWHTIGGPDVIYPDRAEQDRTLLSYTSAPLADDLEITGSPSITLFLSTTESDGAVHIYLEDVAPDGRVTYVTEGLLRLASRALSTSPPYDVEGVYHSLMRGDARPMVPGKTERIVVPLSNVSALIKRGHRIRVAIAGADSHTFAPIPADGEPRLTIERNRTGASFIDIPQGANK